MKRFITACICLMFLAMPVMAQNNNLYTRIKRHIARKIAQTEQQRQEAARQRYYAELAVWQNAVGGNVDIAKKFYAQLGKIETGLDVFSKPILVIL